MNIKTKTFQVTPKQLKQLIINNYFQTNKKVLIFLTVDAILFPILALIYRLFIDLRFFNKLLTDLAISFPIMVTILLVAPFLIDTKKTQSVVNFIPRYWEIDEDFICIYHEDGSIYKLRFDHLVKAVKSSEFYLVYVTIQQFHYLPIAAFETEKDIHRFELFLESKQLIKLW